MMGGYGYGYGPMMGGGWLGWVLMMGFWFLVVVGGILLFVWFVRSASRHATPGVGPAQPAAPTHDEAMAIARRRFANGEITADQFEEIRKTLGGS